MIFEHADGFRSRARTCCCGARANTSARARAALPLLRFADLVRDEGLVAAARAAAELMLDRHPDAAARHAARWMSGRSELMAV